MSARVKVAAVIVLLIGIGVLLFGLRSCSADDTDSDAAPSDDPAPSESLAPVQMSTEQISDAIKAKLDDNAGQPTRVECPEKVDQKVGTTFECDVFFADQPDTGAVSTASVEINGPDGAFVWEAVRNE
ncbi:DUF4333 domain-containing protein [Aeromicrobium sp. CTD01-1L150]|uniref:DUF4333 domain-containing protein n=1 Tax=Aeromicrobium sp. CTD01-1L150 TaxID=3341830 RepID=UPI0035C1828A